MRWKKDSIIFLLISLLIVSSGLPFFTSSPKASRNNFGENDPPLEGKTIAIDPGHGGSDPGAYGIDGSGFPNEKDFNLDIALRVRNLLEMAGAEVIMTRSNDTSVSLDERCNIANNASSDIFVSIHMNSAVESAQGTETFYWAEDDTNYSVEGKKLAQDVQGQVTSKLNTYDRGEKGDKPYLGYHLRVLDNTNMPAILNEVCFISNQANYDMITQREKRTKASLAIYEGIFDHFQKETKRGKVEQDGYPLDGSYITREVNFAKSLTNTSMLTHASWSIDGEHQGELYNREWYFNEDVFTQPVLDTYQYSTGWHDLTITTENLWDNSETHILSYKFERSPIAEASTYGSSSAHKLADDNDSSYAANDLNEPLYIELPCNLTLETLKNHFWDGDDRYYQYKVEISSDNNTWTEVVNNTDDEYRGWVLDSISDQKARYIKITGTNNSANQWYHIFESKLFVKESKVLYGEATVEGEPYTGNVSVENLDGSDSLTTSIESGKLWIDASSLSYQSGDRFEVRYLKEGVKGNNTVTVDNQNVTEKVDINGIESTSFKVEIKDPDERSYQSNSSMNVDWNLISGNEVDYYEIRKDNGTWIETGKNTSHVFEDLSEGTHFVEVKAYSNSNMNDTDTVNFTVDQGSPSLNISDPSNGSVLAYSNVTVSWEGIDTLSGISTYRLLLDDGSWKDLGSSTSHELNELDDGKHVVKIKGIDKAGNENFSKINLNIDTKPPRAECGPDKTVSIGEEFLLDADSSSDNIGIATYTWRWDDNEDHGAEIIHSFFSRGVYHITLNVTDGAGNYDTDSVTITVKDQRPPTAIANADNTTVSISESVEFNASNSSDNVAISNYTWIIEGEKYEGVAVTHPFEKVGNYTAKLTVTDTSGNSDTDTVVITVKDYTEPTAAGDISGELKVGREIIFDGSPSTDNVGIVSYEWELGDGTTAQGENVTHTYGEGGNYTVRLTVRDANGNSDAYEMKISVGEADGDDSESGVIGLVGFTSMLLLIGAGISVAIYQKKKR